MQLLKRLKQAFMPRSHSSTYAHYIPAPNFAADPVELSVWRSELEKPAQDWKGTGRVPNAQVLTTQGPLLFPLKSVTTAGLGGADTVFGQGVTLPVAGFAGRFANLDPTSTAAEFEAVQQ